MRPDHRAPDAEVGISLLAAALREVASPGRRAPAPVGPQAHRPQTDAMAETCGLRRGRDLYQMRRPLPVEDDQSPGRHPTRSSPASTRRHGWR